MYVAGLLTFVILLLGSCRAQASDHSAAEAIGECAGTDKRPADSDSPVLLQVSQARHHHVGNSPELKWVNDPLAVCLDGSSYGFYWQKASDPTASEKWLFFLQGGGECTSQASCQSQCGNGTGLTTSCGLSPSQECGFGGECSLQQWHSVIATADQKFLSVDPVVNPVMHGWNHVYMPFCSQDQWSGTRTSSNSTWGYRFAGHYIVKAVVSNLRAHGLAAAGEVVLSGVSSGGMGVYIHANWLQDQLPDARVVIAPIAGFFGFGYKYAGPNPNPAGLATFTDATTASYVQLWESYLPQECASRLGATLSYRCFLANFSAPFLKVPQFVIQAQTDCVQLLLNDYLPVPTNLSQVIQPMFGNADEIDRAFNQQEIEALYGQLRRQYLTHHQTRAYMEEYKYNNSIGLMASLKQGDGIFNPACFVHSNFATDKPLIQGKSFMDGFGEWLVNGTDVRLQDTCGLLCGHCSLCIWA
ncbi:unnamed protein product [Polarella glacialis]|uniref:Pectin acetylesterase n=1 Tax=Polarella glacialis TaxID=89957 RepID=A0A813JCR9_POLGL|nr:unnamed protein product [Polarella glacialis]CAE8678970.1 unnamed protein product [Polarella glacialis]